MGSDGIWEKKSSKEMIEWVKKKMEGRKLNDQLLKDLLTSVTGWDISVAGNDNMCATLISFD